MELFLKSFIIPKLSTEQLQSMNNQRYRSSKVKTELFTAILRFASGTCFKHFRKTLCQWERRSFGFFQIVVSQRNFEWLLKRLFKHSSAYNVEKIL